VTSASRPTARMLREAAKAELARELRASLARHDLAQVDVAIATGATDSIVQRWADPERAESASIADVPGIARAGEPGRAVAHDLLAWAAERCGLQVIERLSVDDDAGPTTWLRVLSTSLDRAHALHQQIVAALDDDTVTADELTAIERKATDLEQLAASVRAAIATRRKVSA
jgi:hypothetical protein